MKKTLFFLCLVIGISASQINAQAPITLFGLNLKKDAFLLIEHLQFDMRLDCYHRYNRDIGYLMEVRNEYITCSGKAKNEKGFVKNFPIVSFTLTKHGPYAIIFHCALYNFCSGGPAIARIVEDLLDQGIVPRLTPYSYEVPKLVGRSRTATGNTYTMFEREFQSYSYTTDTNLETVINHCYLDYKNNHSLCVMPKPELEKVLWAPDWRDEDLNWYKEEWGPAIVLQTYPLQFRFYDRTDFGGGFDSIWDENKTILTSPFP